MCFCSVQCLSSWVDRNVFGKNKNIVTFEQVQSLLIYSLFYYLLVEHVSFFNNELLLSWQLYATPEAVQIKAVGQWALIWGEKNGWERRGLVAPLLASVAASCGHDMSLEICLMNIRNLLHYAENVWDWSIRTALNYLLI